MTLKCGTSFSCLATSPASHCQTRRGSQLSLLHVPYCSQRCGAQQLRYVKGNSCMFRHQIGQASKRIPNSHSVLFAVAEDQSEYSDIKPDATELENHCPNSEDIFPSNSSYIHFDGTGGKPGLVSFYNRPYKKVEEVSTNNPERKQNSLLWFIGPAVLLASFIFPSLYLRKILSTIFEDSLLTDFLILFFTEALFYSGVAVFLLLIDRLRRTTEPELVVPSNRTPAPQLGQRISSVASLVLSLIIPMVTMGYVWPWTGPAASATLAPYLVGIVVQFAFEQYARYKKSPSWPVIPVIFQVYRLHQLNRAAQLVTALSFTVRGAETTPHNLAINSSLGTLLNVLQCLGVICIWSLSSFLMRDLKASNVLLDDSMNPKISDFGMAKIFEINQTEANTKRVVGTFGYMSPEYARYGHFSEKLDVFSFRVLLLEIGSAKKNAAFYCFEHSPTLAGWAWELWKEGRGNEVIDESVRETCRPG